MILFLLGCAIGAVLGVGIVVPFIFREPQRINTVREVIPARKIDGIWNVRDERRRNPVDPSRPRQRKVVILDRKRKWRIE